MTSSTLTNIRNFVLLAIVQVLIFSHIHLFGYATAYIYLIFLSSCHATHPPMR